MPVINRANTILQKFIGRFLSGVKLPIFFKTNRDSNRKSNNTTRQYVKTYCQDACQRRLATINCTRVALISFHRQQHNGRLGWQRDSRPAPASVSLAPSSSLRAAVSDKDVVESLKKRLRELISVIMQIYCAVSVQYGLLLLTTGELCRRQTTLVRRRHLIPLESDFKIKTSCCK